MHERAAVAVILGSAYREQGPRGLDLEPVRIETAFGPATLCRVAGPRPAWVAFRHGLPHPGERVRLLPHEVNHRAQAAALAEVGCGALLLTSSVGVLDPALPLFQPMLAQDLLMMTHHLPDGSPATMFVPPWPRRAHLVPAGPLFSEALNAQVAALAQGLGTPVAARVTYAHVDGPRTKTPAEGAAWARLGAQVNSMTLGPEAILAAELEIPVAALLYGHKHSDPASAGPGCEAIAASLEQARETMEALVLAFLRDGEPTRALHTLFEIGA